MHVVMAKVPQIPQSPNMIYGGKWFPVFSPNGLRLEVGCYGPLNVLKKV